MAAKTSKQQKRVYFFGTCLMDAIYPRAGMAAMRLLQREGVEVVFPQQQTCCGQPAYNTGLTAEAKAVARKQLLIFTKDYPIVVPSGSCAGMMRHHYPQLFRNDPLYDTAQYFAKRVYEFSEYLVRVLKVQFKDKGPPIQVTWHSSCHALREMGIIGDSKQLLRQLENVTLLELERERECCGFGGTFAIKQPEISAAMVQSKVADIVATGAKRVISGDCGCLMNITGAMGHQGAPVMGQHLADFMWERTNG